MAVTSILLGNGLTDIFGQPPGKNATAAEVAAYAQPYTYAAIQVAFLAGTMYTLIGLLRLGWITYFLSHATVSGFMSGASVIIALSQVKYIFGLTIPRSDTVQGNLENIFDNIDQFS